MVGLADRETETHSGESSKGDIHVMATIKISNCDVCNGYGVLRTYLDIFLCDSCINKARTIGPRNNNTLEILRKKVKIKPLDLENE